MKISKRTGVTTLVALGCTVTLLLLHGTFKSISWKQSQVNYGTSRASIRTSVETLIPTRNDTNRAELRFQVMENVVTNTEVNNAIEKSIADALQAEQERTIGALDSIDIQSIGKTFEKAEWTDAGFSTVPSLVETYYFSLREGQIHKTLECVTPKELLGWHKFLGLKESVLSGQFSNALREETEYQIESIVQSPGKEFVVRVSHLMMNGSHITERLAVAAISNQWKTAGISGGLNYPHRPGILSRYDHPTNH